MTNRERRAIIRAIRYIHADEDNGGNYQAGMDILARLAGMPTTLSDALKNVRAVPFTEIASRPNSQFQIITKKESTHGR